MASSLLTQPFEGGVAGSQVSTANPGTLGAVFEFVPTLTSGQTLILDTAQAAHGSQSMKVATGATSATAYADWRASFAWASQTWFRCYVYFTANPASAVAGDVVTFLQTGTLCGRIRISTAGKVTFLDSAGTIQLTSTASINLNGWSRIEGFLIGSATVGQLEFKLFNTMDSTTATETQTSGSTLNTFGVPNYGRWGLAQSVSNGGPLWLDDIGLSATGYIGAFTSITDTDTGTAVDASSSNPTDSDVVSWLEALPVITLTSTESSTGADAGTVATGTNISSSDTGTFAEAQHVATGSGISGPSFPLIFNMTPSGSAVTSKDTGSFTESLFQVQALVQDSDDGNFNETRQSITSGGIPVTPPVLAGTTVEAFSITHAAILVPGDDAELGTLYGVRSAQLTPNWIQALTRQDDWVQSVWNAPGSVQVQIQEGFIPFDTMDALGFGPLAVSGVSGGLLDQAGQNLLDQAGFSLLDQSGIATQPAGAQGAGGVIAAIPLHRQHVTGQFPMLLRASGKDIGGTQRTIQLVLYKAQFSPIVFDGPAYKNGLTATFNATLVLSSTDEAGTTLPSPAYGRLLSMPQGASGFVPVTVFRHHVSDIDSAQFINESAIAGPSGGSQHVSDSDFFHGADGQRVTSSVINLSDTDGGRFMDAGSAGPRVLKSSSDTGHFAESGIVTVGGTVALYVGFVSSPAGACPSSVNDWLSHGQPTIGPGLSDKQFYSGTQALTTYSAGHLGSDNESHLPAGVVRFITVKDAQLPNVTSYCQSVPDNVNLWICYWQEAEDSFPGGNFTQFIANFKSFSNSVRAAGKANIKIFQDCASSKYTSPSSPPAQGAWLVPPAYVDAYTLDIYQDPTSAGDWPSQGLANFPRWLNWLGVFAGQGRQLGITEYGVGASGGNAARNQRITDDCAYLRSAFPPTASAANRVSPFPLLTWTYWWSDCTAGTFNTNPQKQHQFTDAATITTWQQIEAGTL